MLLSDDPVAGEVIKVMRRAGFERLLDVPAVPARAERGMRYDRATTVAPWDESWHIRSFGVTFTLLPRTWASAGMLRCYSLGWGLSNGKQTTRLLLAQANMDRATDAEELGYRLDTDLAEHTEHLERAVRQGQPWTSLHLAADLASALRTPTKDDQHA